MKLFLNNLLKGLLTAFVVVLLGGFISLKIKMPPERVMVLVSSSLANSIGTKINDDTLTDEETLQDDSEKKEVEIVSNEKTPDVDDNSNKIIEENKDIVDNNASSSNQSTLTEKPEKNDSANGGENQESTSSNQNNQSESNSSNNEVSIKGRYSPNLEVLNTVTVLATYYGKITAYGPDCYGCTSGRTASGQYVKEGNIYYQDKTYGNIRIVAADSSIPFGSIIKITGINVSSDPIIAIVLDRGGAIGFAESKHAYFDLLYQSEKDALSFGRQTATFELLRKGY